MAKQSKNSKTKWNNLVENIKVAETILTVLEKLKPYYKVLKPLLTSAARYIISIVLPIIMSELFGK